MARPVCQETESIVFVLALISQSYSHFHTLFDEFTNGYKCFSVRECKDIS